MTNNQHGQVPEALRLAALLDADEWPGSLSLVSYARACVAELLRLHAENQVLRTTHVQSPTENEHVAGDVWKNGVKLNMSTQQKAAEASRFGSPELQAMIVARCVEKDQADSVLYDPKEKAAESVPAVEREQERIAFKDAHRHLELYEVPDAWGRPMFKHSHVEASWLGWIARASHVQAPAGAGMGHTDGGRNMFYEGRFDGESQREQQARLRWANDMRAAFERHTGNGWFDKDWRTETGLWSSAWHACLAAQPTTTAQAADSVQEDAARYRHLRDGEWRDTDLEPFIRLQLNTMWDAKIDAARKQGANHDR